MIPPEKSRTGRTARVVTALSHPGLIRIISDIDDNGPVDRRMLQRTFADLTRHQVRHALDAGRALGLVRLGRHARTSYLLTDRGTGLAEVYDTAARWARTHQFPSTAADFVTRVQHTLLLLSRVPTITYGPASFGRWAQRLVDAGLLPHSEAASDLYLPWTALTAWIQETPQVLTEHGLRSTTGADEGEHAA
ncbi:hypothetical protein [Streptomyces sp. NPDC003077]|uniref:hypothetical protein n=1 Tax=Streptomyces sp. NPDC003077 TaxID=3154443 RepID=UPI0033B24F54